MPGTGHDIAAALSARPAGEAPWLALRRSFDPLLMHETYAHLQRYRSQRAVRRLPFSCRRRDDLQEPSNEDARESSHQMQLPWVKRR